MRIETQTMPAAWASALINNEDSLTYAENRIFQEYIYQNPEYANPVSCSEEATLERFNGLLTECLVYSFLRGD